MSNIYELFVGVGWAICPPLVVNSAWALNHAHPTWLGDADFRKRWRLLKIGFSRVIPKTEYRSNVRKAANERGIWQRHFWEHSIRDETDFERHVDYVHINPVKHGSVKRVIDWPYSSFHRYVEKGIYPENWGGDLDLTVTGDD